MKPDKRAHKKANDFPEDSLIVGFVARNQRRKLFPDLCQAFSEFLRSAPQEISRRTFLYLHTSWPDLGWDIPRLIREEGIGSRVLLTYWCKACGAVFPGFFQDALAVCRKCGNHSAGFPTSQRGVDEAVMAEIYGLFDCYVQYANSEGFGIPVVEAATCGVPVFAVDYSAMSDVVRKVGGFPVEVERLTREPETHCWRALPDNQDFVRKLTAYLSLPEPVRRAREWKTRELALRNYNWDATAKVWADQIDALPPARPWDSPFEMPPWDGRVPENLSNSDFVGWGMTQVAARPDLASGLLSLRMTRDLLWGCTRSGEREFSPFDRGNAMDIFKGLRGAKDYWERARMGAR